jgi:hypothetical protein
MTIINAGMTNERRKDDFVPDEDDFENTIFLPALPQPQGGVAANLGSFH